MKLDDERLASAPLSNDPHRWISVARRIDRYGAVVQPRSGSREAVAIDPERHVAELKRALAATTDALDTAVGKRQPEPEREGDPKASAAR